MKVLVFGQSGQVARELARALPAAGIEARFLNRNAADLTDAEACANLVTQSDAAVVINAAAYTAVDRAEIEPTLAWAINAQAPGAMACAAAARGLPFLHLSTDYVFDGSGSRAWRPDDATAPINSYGRSKCAGEDAVRAAGGAHVILRTSWVISAHGANFVRTMLRLGAERSEIGVVADQIGAPTPAADIAHALARIAWDMAEGRGTPGTHHLSGAQDVAWADVAREVMARAQLPCRVRDITTADYPTPARRPANSRLDCTSLHEAFGIAQPDWTTGLNLILKELT